ncbi:DUF1700 domain-containing protein [Spiroplasma floricola]|uniref:DUF1700 domain-containing protein n=1 Tax=Spiroplasma floricola 23-6 TaxID=1336749 RepID=A0A2K8SED0_9MOLU|nr:DUF1700 domain-containing protein [Spiroplasma floricola]AUB31608.1 hypothetical protein SFLOR_v1c05560 [Spiroplasma floricola 23-6]
MKIEILFLKNLEKQLRFLKPKDREDFISNYRLQIYDRYKSGESTTDIINSFESPESIASNIYQELEIDIKKEKAKEYKSSGLAKMLLGLSTILPQILVFLFSIIFFTTSFVLIVGFLFSLVLFWLNFETLQAIGGTFLSLGLLPLLAILFFYIGIEIYKFEKLFFKISIELVVGREMEIYNKTDKVKSKKNKIIIIILLSVFSLFTFAGVIGTFAGPKTIGGASLSGNMINTKTDTLNYSSFMETKDNEKLNFNYSFLRDYSWYKINLIEDKELKSELKVKRDYNFKSSLNFDYEIKQDKNFNNYHLQPVNVSLNLKIFNISSIIFTITYNPDEVKF